MLQLHVLGKWLKALVAVLLGNLVYFLLLAPHLPAAGRHRPNHLDWDLVIDFWVCVAMYGLVDLVARNVRPSPPSVR